MATPNVQNLPPGLAGRAAAATAAPAPEPVAPIDRGPVEVPPAAPAPTAPPVAAPAPAINPMLSHVSQPSDEPTPTPAPAVEVPAPAPLVPVEVPKEAPQVAEQSATVTAMVGELSKDPNLSAAVAYLDGACTDGKVDTARAFGTAAEEGDARFIDRAYLRDVLGDKADAVIKTAEGVLAYTNAYAAQTVESVHKLAGNEQQWDAAMALFNTKASPEQRALMGELFDSGIRSKVEHAAQQVIQFAVQAGGAVQHNAPALGQPASQQGLSKDEYIKAISVRNLPDAEYTRLRSLRELGRSQGKQ